MIIAEKALKRLWDAGEALRAVADFVDGKTLGDYQADPILQSAVERKLSIVGEALAAARTIDPALLMLIEHVTDVIKFRNVLIHQYFEIDHSDVWINATVDAPLLQKEIARVLAANP